MDRPSSPPQSMFTSSVISVGSSAVYHAPSPVESWRKFRTLPRIVFYLVPHLKVTSYTNKTVGNIPVHDPAPSWGKRPAFFPSSRRIVRFAHCFFPGCWVSCTRRPCREVPGYAYTRCRRPSAESSRSAPCCLKPPTSRRRSMSSYWEDDNAGYRYRPKRFSRTMGENSAVSLR